MTGLIPEETINAIKNTADIVEIISETVILKKAGKNFLGLCPFHSEKTPSFTVSPDKQIFYCFGCREGGNVFSFLMKHDGLSFPESARILAGRYGIDVPDVSSSPTERRQATEKERLFEVNRLACEFFQRTLSTGAAGEPGRRYLASRGLSPKIVDGFRIGFAPDAWDHLLRYGNRQGASAKLLERAGLVIPKKGGNGFYDRFRNRVIFPISDVGGRVIGFGGRVMDDALPKYLNSPETPLYNKSRSLYGLDHAKGACRQCEAVFVVEGYIDLLALHQHGLLNAVATLGTALTPEHVQVLRGFARRIVLVFDSDAAGIKAAMRSVDLFMQAGVEGQVIVLPTGYDPDAFLMERGREAFEQAAAGALGLIPFLIRAAEKRNGRSVEGKVKTVDDLVPTLAGIQDGVSRGLHVKQLAEHVGIEEAAVADRVAQALNRRGGSSMQTAAKPQPPARPDAGTRIERKIVAMMLQFPEIIPEIRSGEVLDRFEDRRLKAIGAAIVRRQGFAPADIPDLLGSLEDRETRNLVASLSLHEEAWDFEGCRRLLAQFTAARKKTHRNLLNKIKEAEAESDHELLMELLRQKQEQARNRHSKNVTPLGG